MKVIMKEFVIFFVILVVLSLGMHFDEWTDHPAEHLDALSHSSLGLWHPLFLSFGVYLLVALLRFVFGIVGRIFRKET